MAKRLQEYVKYTTKELDQYTQTEGSCVRKINTNLHISMGPFCLSDFKNVLMAHLVQSKVGFYDVHLEGIVLDVKKIKVLGTTGALRTDDPRIHININADVYVFKPKEGAELTGVVKHIGPHQVGVILYRVFNANLRVAHKVDKEEIQIDQEVKFRIRKYNLQNVFPYIDGELLMPGAETSLAKEKKIYVKKEDNYIDSGIEKDDGHEQEDLLTLIKVECPTVYTEALDRTSKKKSKKSKKSKKNLEDSDITESFAHSLTKKTSKKRKISIAEDSTNLTLTSSKEIEIISDDDSLSTTSNIFKKENEVSHEKAQTKSCSSNVEVKIKQDPEDKHKKSKKSKKNLEDSDITESFARSLTKKTSKKRKISIAEDNTNLTLTSAKEIEIISDDDWLPTTSNIFKKESEA